MIYPKANHLKQGNNNEQQNDIQTFVPATADPLIRPLLNQYLIGQAIGIVPFVCGGLLSSYLSLVSSLGLWIFCIIQVPHFLSGKSIFRFSWKELSWRESASLLRIGLPGAANNGYQTIRGLIVNMLITQFVGAAGLSAFTAANTLLSLVWAVPIGMLNVSRMLISISVGIPHSPSLHASGCDPDTPELL